MPSRRAIDELDAGARPQISSQSREALRGHISQAGEWDVAAPEAVGLDAAPLHALDRHLTSIPDANVHSVLVVRKGALVYERYFSGEDVAWGRPLGRLSFDADTKHDMRSITKSVTSLLVGIAIDRKMIESIDEPVFKFVPAYADLFTAEKKRLLVRHLLTMSAGLEWDQNISYSDPRNSEIQMIRSPDPRRFVLEAPMNASPGEEWCFSAGTVELLGAVVEHATGRRIDDFARQFLFEPLGIMDIEWTRYPRGTGLPAASSGLRLRPRDMVKLGQLLLQRGQWNGQQIVPVQWVDASTTPQIAPSDNVAFYGFHWWLGRSLVGKREISWFAGTGVGGQRLCIVPALDLVVAMTGGSYKSPDRVPPLVIFNRYVLAAVNDF